MAVSVTIGGIILYTLLVGADAAVPRAALMGILFVIAIGLGRQSTAIISLFVAAMIMLLLNPLTLWDVGFQLSAMATLGLILFSQPLQRAWDARIGKRIPKVANNLLAEALLVTLAAQITTMPLVVYYFGRLSIISFLANFLIIPVQPPIMIAGGLAIFAGFVFLPLAKLIALIPYASLWWTVFVVEKMAAVPWGSVEVSTFGRMLAGLLILPLWTGATWWESQPDGRLHIQLLGREQGVTFLIITPGGNCILLDLGSEATDCPLDTILDSLPGGSPPLDLVIPTRLASGQPQEPVLSVSKESVGGASNLGRVSERLSHPQRRYRGDRQRWTDFQSALPTLFAGYDAAITAVETMWLLDFKIGSICEIEPI